MTDRPAATDRSHDPDTGDGGYFASLTSARYMLLTTFKRDGTSVSAPVRGVVDGDRAYFRAWEGSAQVKCLQHIDAVQVTSCTALGLCTFGPPLDATVRLLSGTEASRIARKLAAKHKVRQRFLIPLLRRIRPRQVLHYELLARDPSGERDADAEGAARVLRSVTNRVRIVTGDDAAALPHPWVSSRPGAPPSRQVSR